MGAWAGKLLKGTHAKTKKICSKKKVLQQNSPMFFIMFDLILSETFLAEKNYFHIGNVNFFYSEWDMKILVSALTFKSSNQPQWHSFSA